MKRSSVIASDATFKYFLFEVERPLLHVSQCPVFFTGRGCNTYNKLAKRVFNSDADLLKENRGCTKSFFIIKNTIFNGNTFNHKRNPSWSSISSPKKQLSLCYVLYSIRRFLHSLFPFPSTCTVYNLD